ncbi:MAG TPA: anti-sigma factor [Oculatellaceae cyanobacterium]|jgi:anti-sigma-K factor RskA
MTEPLLPERHTELMAGYVLGNLSSQEAEEFNQLLKEHPELNTEINSLQEVLALMPYTLSEIEPPPHIKEAVLQTVHSEMQRKPTQKRFSLPWSQIAGALAATFILALGWDNYHLKQQVSTLEIEAARQKDVIAMLKNPDTHLVALKGMDRAQKAGGSVVMTPGEPKSVLILQNLPILPKGQFYQLWAVVNGEKIPSGTFNANSQGTVLVKLATPPTSEVTGLVVTVEASPVPQIPSGPMVMTSNL